jgi:tol-pal system protein YbgF
MNIFKSISLGLLSLSLQSPAIQAEPQDIQDEAGYATSTLDARVARLEKKAANQPLTEVVREIDRQREELKKLRGLVEEMHNALERQSVQTALLLQKNAELEARLSGGATVAPATPSPVLAPAEGVAAVPAPASTSDQPKPAGSIDSALAAPKPQVAPPDPFARQKEYEHAFETLKAAKYTEAISEFQAFVAKYPTGDYSDSAHYWLGEALYVNRAFVPAREAFRKMIADFPQSAKVPDAKLKLAYIEYENQQYPRAKELLSEIAKSYPNSATAKMAEKRLERMRQENR